VRVLVVGGGGREHAIVWRLAQNPTIDRLYAAPGNAGIAREATCVDIAADDVKELVAFAEREGIDLTVVGPEAPLVAGLVDEHEARGLPAFGPTRRGSRDPRPGPRSSASGTGSPPAAPSPSTTWTRRSRPSRGSSPPTW